jgi:hypothetical protein
VNYPLLIAICGAGLVIVSLLDLVLTIRDRPRPPWRGKAVSSIATLSYGVLLISVGFVAPSFTFFLAAFLIFVVQGIGIRIRMWEWSQSARERNRGVAPW